MPYPFPGDISAEQFLAEYWQKQPLLIRNAFPGFQSPLSANELAGLACEEDVNARIVFEHHEHGPWHVEHGPFEEDDFSTLPDTHWTLLVTDIEKRVPETRELVDHFRFIPDWRIDDLMMSYAADGGSVGPHTDAYDVFLVQAEGRRRWKINTTYDDTCIDGLELRILQHFHAAQEWVLEPGDMLYLPPNVAHHGIAEGGECITCSIGFRAPSVRQVISEYAESLASTIDRELRYADPDLEYQPHPGEISARAIEKVQAMLREHLVVDTGEVARWFGRFSTEPRGLQHAIPAARRASNCGELKALLSSFPEVQHSSTSRLAYICNDSGEALLFADGDSHACSEAFAIAITSDRCLNSDALLGNLKRREDEEALVALFNSGAIRIEGYD